MAFRSLFNDDIFISYSRSDGGDYVVGLDNELTKRGYSCFTDNKGTDAGEEPPSTLYSRVRGCKTLVFLGTHGAVASPLYVAREVAEFAEANGTLRIVPLSFDRGQELDVWKGATWWDNVKGKTRVREKPEALKAGTPSPEVINRIIEVSDYAKSKDRLRRYRNWALATFLVLLAGSTVAAGLGIKWSKDAAAANELAKKTEREAADRIGKAQQQAEQAEADARVKITEADARAADAEQQQRDAEAAAEKAEAATRTAEEQRVVAERKTREAETLRQQAQARAEREQAIGDSRALANRSETLLRQRPHELPRSLRLAVDSAEKSSAVGVQLVEADTALRDSLALLPRLWTGDDKYEVGFVAALSPDGRHFAALSDNQLRIYESGKQAPIKEVACDCSAVALSSGPYYAAVVTEGGVKILDLRDDARSHLIKPDEGLSPDKIALSPDGRYLALTVTEGEDVGTYSRLMVLDAASGKVIKSFDDAQETEGEEGEGDEGNAAPSAAGATKPGESLNMVINSVAFGPTGNLAVGGKYNSPQGGRFTGRVLIWPLSVDLVEEERGPGEAGTEAHAELTAGSFPETLIIPLATEVTAVAPGTNSTYFSTETGVWKRMPGQTTYEPVARFPYLRSYESSSTIERMAFSPDGSRLELVRDVTANDEAEGNPEELLEVWDSSGHRDLAHVSHPEAINSVGFNPDGQFVATTTDQKFIKKPFSMFKTIGGNEVDSEPFGPAAEDGGVLYVSPDASQMVTAGEGGLVVWDMWGRKKRTVVGSGGARKDAEQAAVSPGGRFLALFAGVSVELYRLDSDSYSEWKTISNTNGIVERMSLAANGQRLAVLNKGDINSVHVWDVSGTPAVLPTSPRYKDETESENFSGIPDITLMTLSPGGRFLATANKNNQARLLDLSNGQAVTLLDDTVVSSLAFSKDDRYVGLGSDEGVLSVFETSRPETEIARLGHQGAVTAIAFSDDDKYVATASYQPHPFRLDEGESYQLRVWLLQFNDLITEASDRLTRLEQSKH